MGTIDSWSSIEAIIRQRLESNEIDRRYCAVCGRQGPSLSRCFGCQMVYYCGEEHQIEDWASEHAQKCTQLEWVALGEFIQALPAQPPLPNVGDKWPVSLKDINSWKSWFAIRGNIVNLANNTANVLKNLVHVTDKRQLTYQNAVDGLLAAVTDLLTHVLTIGKAIVCFGLQPNIRPLVIHILTGFNKIDLVGNNQPLPNLPARFHELLNMFPDNKGVELVIVIGDDDQDDTDYSSLPHSKLKPDRLIITTTGKGRLLDTFEEKRLQPPVADLLVYLNAAHLFSPSNKELLISMFTRQKPTLLTFEDQDEFNQAQRYLSSKGVNIQQAGTNQFSSLIIRQRPSRPNSTYSTNSYQILLNAAPVNGTVERNEENCSLLSRQRSHQSSIGIQHGHAQQQQQQLNPGLKQVNGKIHIEAPSSSSSSTMSHNTQANNNGTLLDTNVHIVSTANTAPTVQPLVRSNNNNTRQPTIVQRRHHSPSTLPSSSPAITMPTSYRATNLTTAEMMTTAEIVRHDHRPQPKPRLSLVKTIEKDTNEPTSYTNGSLVQRIKPFFEQPNVTSHVEPKNLKQQRQSVSIPYTYQINSSSSKATCLDDLIPSTNVYITSPPPSMETNTHQRTVTTTPISSSLPKTEPLNRERTIMTNTLNTVQISKPTVERPMDEQMKTNYTNSVPSSSITPNEIHRDQRTVLSAPTIASPPPISSTIPSSTLSLKTTTNENRSDERIVKTTALNNVLSEPSTDQPSIEPMAKPISPPPSSSTNNEIIYTEVIKNHMRPLPSHHIDLIKSPTSPSRSFIIPTKSLSISSKNASFQVQRPSRSQLPATTTTITIPTTSFVPPPNRPKPIQSSTIPPDRISLYSQKSMKQSEGGLTIKNISECIDRVGIVFDDNNRRNDQALSGLTAVDLIREQLANSSTAKSNESLLDKLYKSNSSTRLPTSSKRISANRTTPRSKSQQPPRTHDEQPPSTSKTNSTPSQSIRRPAGVFLPLAPKHTHESEHSPTLVYQNLEPQNIVSSNQVLDYTLKQPSGPICIGIPKPFRKPTAIIEPSPVVASPVKKTSEPNYINFNPQNEHIYSNENGLSNSNSYTSKTSSIYSTSDKQNSLTTAETHYAISHVLITPQEQSVEYDSFDDELVMDDNAKIEKPLHSNDNTDNDSFDDDDNQLPTKTNPSKNSSSMNFIRSTLNRLTRSNKSLERLNNDPATNEFLQETNPSTMMNDTKTKKTLRSIKARHEAKKTGHLLSTPYTGDDDTTSIDSNCSTQTATSLNKSAKSSNNRFRLFRRKTEKEFASDTEAEKHQTEQRRKKWNKKVLSGTTQIELKHKRLLMMSDDDDDDVDNNLNQENKRNSTNDENHIYDHIIHDDNNNNLSRMGKLSNETHSKPPTITLDEIRSEIRAEIAARHDTQPTNNQSNLNLQKKRSKSVTFLDELLGDDSKQQQQQKPSSNLMTKTDVQTKPSTTIKRIEKGDARSICGALTGTGPIRGIIKAANNEIIGTTAPISPSAAAAIYLGGTSIETRCTSPKATERTHRLLTTYTVGSARFYDGTPGVIPSTAAPPPPPPANSFNQNNNNNNNNNISNQRPILNNTSPHLTSNSTHYKRPTAKVSPFQTKSPNETSSSSPVPVNKPVAFSSSSKKPIRPSTQRTGQISSDATNV